MLGWPCTAWQCSEMRRICHQATKTSRERVFESVNTIDERIETNALEVGYAVRLHIGREVAFHILSRDCLQKNLTFEPIVLMACRAVKIKRLLDFAAGP